MTQQARPTLYAQKGLEFVAVFTAKLATRDVCGYKPRLREPPGVSTAGGKQATQHIVLEPADPQQHAWTVGFLNVATNSAKLRSFACMEQLHKARFGDAPFTLNQKAYQEFFESAFSLLKERGLMVEVENELPDVIPPSQAGSLARDGGELGGPSIITIALIGITVLLAAGLAALWFLRGRFPF